MRTLLGLSAVALALAAGAQPAHAGCVDDFLRGDDYLAPRQDTVEVNGTDVTVHGGNAAGDVTEVAGFVLGVTLNEAGRVVVLVDCVK